jgi:UPF0755 protein
MIRKIILYAFVFILLAAAFLGWEFLGPATAFNKEKYYLFIKTGMDYGEVMNLLQKDEVLKSPLFFKLLAKKIDYPANIKAGKYEIKKNMSLVDIARMLRNGRQTPVNLVITKLRTKEDLASAIGKRFECDSLSVMDFLENNDSLKKHGLDSNTVMAAVFPDTYTYFWNTNPSRIFKKFFIAYQNFWTDDRKQKAQQRNLDPVSAYILASIIEEETNKKEDKAMIASTYLNRISKGMKLSADPTIKFAMHNFELKRIYDKYLLVESPYNTYKYAGLPPGPICTPTQETIDAVLNSPKTNYLYFVAKPDFSGYSNFSETFEQHLKYAKEYQKALDIEMAKKQNAGKIN